MILLEFGRFREAKLGKVKEGVKEKKRREERGD